MFPCYITKEFIASGSTIKVGKTNEWCYNKSNVCHPVWDKEIKVKLNEDSEEEKVIFAADLDQCSIPINSYSFKDLLDCLDLKVIQPGTWKVDDKRKVGKLNLMGVMLTEKGTGFKVDFRNGKLTIKEIDIKEGEAAVILPDGWDWLFAVFDVLNVQSLFNTVILMETVKHSKCKLGFGLFNVYSGGELVTSPLSLGKEEIDTIVSDFDKFVEELK